jgi:hypothetical protein
MPVFVPVHDPKRDAYIGLEHGGWPYESEEMRRWAVAEGELETEATTRMEADSTACSHPPKELLTLAGQHSTFASLLRGALPPQALASAHWQAHVKLTFPLVAPPSSSAARGTFACQAEWWRVSCDRDRVRPLSLSPPSRRRTQTTKRRKTRRRTTRTRALCEAPSVPPASWIGTTSVRGRYET